MTSSVSGAFTGQLRCRKIPGDRRVACLHRRCLASRCFTSAVEVFNDGSTSIERAMSELPVWIDSTYHLAGRQRRRVGEVAEFDLNFGGDIRDDPGAAANDGALTEAVRLKRQVRDRAGDAAVATREMRDAGGGRQMGYAPGGSRSGLVQPEDPDSSNPGRWRSGTGQPRCRRMRPRTRRPASRRPAGSRR
jgi:hypothetical protein